MLPELLRPDNPELRRSSSTVPRFQISAVQDVIRLLVTMLEINPEAVGIAAPQFGCNLRIFVARLSGEPTVFINPKSDFFSMKRVPVTEECLSLPGKKRRVLRCESVGLSAYNQEGDPFSVLASGAQQAAVLQHEMDHLNGVLIIDRPAVRRRLRWL